MTIVAMIRPVVSGEINSDAEIYITLAQQQCTKT
jgi:hypothetical protein